MKCECAITVSVAATLVWAVPCCLWAGQVERLHTAAQQGDLDTIKAVLAEGVDVNTSNAIGATALHVAASAGQTGACELLLARGANPNARILNGQTPLHWAAYSKQVDAAQQLLAAGADIDARDRNNRTPLDIAVLHRPNEIVDLIVKHDLESTDPPKPKHDVGIINVVVPSVCRQGDIVNATIAVANSGSFRETFEARFLSQTDQKQLAVKTIALAKKWKGKADDSPNLVFNGKTPGDRLGAQAFVGDDINGDTYPDVVVASARWRNGCGRAYLYYGGPKLDAEADMLFDGHDEDCAFAPSVLSDLNNDGCTDLIISAPGRTWGSEHDGYINIYYGGPQMDNVPDVVLKGKAGTAEHLGMMLTAKDIDNDGYVDIIAGAQGYDHLRGRVYLFWGGDPFEPTADLVLEGEQENSLFGRKIDAGGDVNGDGYNDILVGARQFGGEARLGRAYLFLGNRRERMDSLCDWSFTGQNAGQLGSAVGIFDIDADGFADVIVGSRGVRSVYLFWGTRDFDPKEPNWVLQAPSAAALGGDDVQCDYFNHDRFGDILVGAQGYPGTGYMYGRAYLFYGNTKALMDADHDYIFGGECGANDLFGNEVSAGDLNVDGYVDALMGTVGANQDTGKAYLYYGPFYDTQDINFHWDTTNTSVGKHTLKVEIPPVPGEQNIDDNVKTVTIEVKKSM